MIETQKQSGQIHCSLEDVTDIKYHVKMIKNYVYAHKKGVNCLTEIRKHMLNISEIASRYSVVIRMTDDVLSDAMNLAKVLMTVRSLPPTAHHITQGVAHV